MLHAGQAGIRFAMGSNIRETRNPSLCQAWVLDHTDCPSDAGRRVAMHRWPDKARPFVRQAKVLRRLERARSAMDCVRFVRAARWWDS